MSGVNLPAAGSSPVSSAPWFKAARLVIQSYPETPTIYELLESYKASDTAKRVTRVMLSSGDLGRPFFAPPGTPAEHVKVLRAAFAKTMNDPELLAEAKKRGWDIDLTTGDELEKLAKEIMVQPADVIERVKNMLGN